MSTDPYILYGSHASYHAAKTRAYLRKKGLPFIERVPGHPRFREHVRPTSGSHRIPQLETPEGEVIQDTSAIVAYLERRYEEPAMRPPGPRQQFACRLLEVLIDVLLLRPAWHFRWDYMDENYGFVGREFGRSFRPTGSDSEVEHYGRVIADRMEGYRAVIGGGAAVNTVLEETVYEVLALLEQHFVSCPYLFGGRPSVADTVLQGPLYGHLARDPVPAMRMKQVAPRVFRWTEHMNAPEIAQPELADVAPEFMAGDQVPEATRGLLAMCLRDHGAALLESIRTYSEWVSAPERAALAHGAPAVEGADEPVIGTFGTTLRGVETTARVSLHLLWLLQDVTDWLDGQPVEAREICLQFADEVGARALMGSRLPRRLTRTANAVALA